MKPNIFVKKWYIYTYIFEVIFYPTLFILTIIVFFTGHIFINFTLEEKEKKVGTCILTKNKFIVITVIYIYYGYNFFPPLFCGYHDAF